MNANKPYRPQVSIFIASSHHANHLVSFLESGIVEYGKDINKYDLVVNPWYKSASRLGGVLDDLLDNTKAHDFAIILLTSKAAQTQGEKTIQQKRLKEENQKIRYNCFYEAGLFTGALGPSKDRVFIVATGGLQDLPSDLYGIRYREFDENGNENELKQKLGEIGREIARTICDYDESDIRPLRGLKRPLLTKEDLFKREAHADMGGTLEQDGSLVFVNTPEPIEMDDEKFAQRVTEYILAHQINYAYVFQNTTLTRTQMGALVYNLVNSLCSNHNAETVAENLDTLCRKLGIYFVRENQGLEFCVHNANSSERAKCYMRWGPPNNKIWVDWAEASTASNVATQINLLRVPGEPHSPRIFHDTINCPVYAIHCPILEETGGLTPLGSELYSHISNRLPKKWGDKIKEMVMVMCFGEQQSHK